MKFLEKPLTIQKLLEEIYKAAHLTVDSFRLFNKLTSNFHIMDIKELFKILQNYKESAFAHA